MYHLHLHCGGNLRGTPGKLQIRATQFIGHYFEGRKPAFVDDLTGLIIGPLFVAAELGFMLGLREPLRLAIEARVGPVRLRDSAAHG